MTDKEIINLYWKRSENAIVETDKKYGSYCYSLSYNIMSNKEDAEECLNDEMLVVEFKSGLEIEVDA